MKTPLTLAIEKIGENNQILAINVIKVLLEFGASVDDSNALIVAERLDQKDVARFLIESGGANVDRRDKDGRTPFLIACAKSELDHVKYLAEKGADIHATDDNDANALHYACMYNHLEVIKYLVESGVNINDKGGDYDDTCLHIAYRHNDRVVNYLIDNGAEVYMLNCHGMIPGEDINEWEYYEEYGENPPEGYELL